jgi:hypothetical protein
MRRIDAGLKKKLKKPLGRLYKQIGKISGKTVAVGDIAAHELIAKGVKPDLIIYDNRVKRKPVSKTIKDELDAVRSDTFYIKNPHGTISEEAWIVIEEGLKKRSKIVVAGEEDLLVLPAVMLAKTGTKIFYGQPGKGIVLISVTEKKKKEIKKLLDAMEVVL